jgi:hypothetical protein
MLPNPLDNVQNYCSCRFGSRPTADCRLKRKDGFPPIASGNDSGGGGRRGNGWLVKNEGDDEDAKMDPRLRPAGMTEWEEDGDDGRGE